MPVIPPVTRQLVSFRLWTVLTRKAQISAKELISPHIVTYTCIIVSNTRFHNIVGCFMMKTHWPMIWFHEKIHLNPFITFRVYLLKVRQTNKEAKRLLVLSQDCFILRDGHSIQDIITYKMDSFFSSYYFCSSSLVTPVQLMAFLFIHEPCDQYIFPECLLIHTS